MALNRLKDKINELKNNYSKILEENKLLENELDSRSAGNNEELENLKIQLTNKDQEILSLHRNIEEKDAEIEVIIGQVEALLGE